MGAALPLQLQRPLPGALWQRGAHIQRIMKHLHSAKKCVAQGFARGNVQWQRLALRIGELDLVAVEVIALRNAPLQLQMLLAILIFDSAWRWFNKGEGLICAQNILRAAGRLRSLAGNQTRHLQGLRRSTQAQQRGGQQGTGGKPRGAHERHG